MAYSFSGHRYHCIAWKWNIQIAKYHFACCVLEGCPLEANNELEGPKVYFTCACMERSFCTVLSFVWFISGFIMQVNSSLPLSELIEASFVIEILIEVFVYSGTSNKGPSEKGTTSLQRTLLYHSINTFLTSEKRTTSKIRTEAVSFIWRFHCISYTAYCMYFELTSKA